MIKCYKNIITQYININYLMNWHLNSLSPTVVLIISAMINHVYRDNKELEMRDFMLILAPTLPTVIPIIMSILSNIITFIYEFVTSINYGEMTICDIIPFNKIVSYFPIFNKAKPEYEVQYCNGTDEFTEYENIQVNVNITYMQLLISYIINNESVANFTIGRKKSIKINAEKKKMETNNWKDITISYKNIEIYISNIKLTFYKNNNELILEHFTQFTDESNSIEECKHFMRLADFLKNQNEKKQFIEVTDKVYQTTLNKIITTGCGFEIAIADIITTVCPNINKKLFIIEFVFLCALFYGYRATSLHQKLCSYLAITNKLKLFSYELKVNHNFKFNSASSLTDANLKLVESSLHTQLPSELVSSVMSINTFLRQLSDKNKTDSDTICFNIKNINNENKINAYDELNEFIDMIQNSNSLPQEGNKIKIYNTIVTKEVNNDNVEFDDDFDDDDFDDENDDDFDDKDKDNKDDELDENHNKDKNKNNNEHNVRLKKTQRKSLPSRYNKLSSKPVVSTKQINEKYKSFNTTYLRKNDTDNLINTLNIFKTESDIFEEYGLPNKLGILLHGEAGTGKTTTIHAIASYLQKNIYYVNLSIIETNEELQMVFDHVFVESANGGIIVFEDIDAMTSVVHKRDTNKVMNEKLTLEYFLNLLQGSLTRDGTIFIATTNHIEVLDPAFYRVGRFDIKINMKKCDHYQIQTIYDKFVKRPIDNNVLEMIEEDKFTPAEIIFHLMNHIKSKADCVEIMEKFIIHDDVNFVNPVNMINTQN